MTTRTTRPTTALFLLATAALLILPAADSAADGYDSRGLIYGKVHTESGTLYEGRLRWNRGGEEASWGDHFNGSKDERPYVDAVPRKDRRRTDYINMFGSRIGLRFSLGSRWAVVRFGDIKKIDVGRGDHAVLHMKDGSELELDGGSNDLGATIRIWDDELGEADLTWSRIDTIEFMQAPAGYEVDVFRLHGKVKTDAGTFEGFIQWDQDECMSNDILNGEGPDGDMNLPMGKIRSIERESHRAALVTLRSGRKLVLSGHNDVNHDNSGIFVEDPRYGRVLVKWDTFERVDFSDPGPSGPSYDEFNQGGAIRGTVTDRKGGTYQGQIVFDLDELQRWEMLNGEADHVEYTIPFALVKTIEPGHDRSDVTLVGGLELTLGDHVDVDDWNAGILVIAGGEKTYIAWEDVERVDFAD